MSELKAKLQDLKWKIQDKWDETLTDPKKCLGFGAVCGVVIGVMLGRL